jgi:hypothetical protein
MNAGRKNPQVLQAAKDKVQGTRCKLQGARYKDIAN